jgi:formyl-CoA transferase
VDGLTQEEAAIVSLVREFVDREVRTFLDVLLDHADVFVHNLAPGAVDRLRLDAASVREPDTIVPLSGSMPRTLRGTPTTWPWSPAIRVP